MEAALDFSKFPLDAQNNVAAILEGELAELCKESFLAYIKHVEPSYRPAPFHLEIIKHLEMLAEGEIRRLMIIMPPQHGKTTLARLFSAWMCGRETRKGFMILSYGSSLAKSTSAAMRDYVSSPEHQLVFPDWRIDERTRSKD